MWKSWVAGFCRTRTKWQPVAGGQAGGNRAGFGRSACADSEAGSVVTFRAAGGIGDEGETRVGSKGAAGIDRQRRPRPRVLRRLRRRCLGGEVRVLAAARTAGGWSAGAAGARSWGGAGAGAAVLVTLAVVTVAWTAGAGFGRLWRPRPRVLRRCHDGDQTEELKHRLGLEQWETGALGRRGLGQRAAGAGGGRLGLDRRQASCRMQSRWRTMVPGIRIAFLH